MISASGAQSDDEIKVAGHAWQGIKVHGHRAGEHVANVRRVEPLGNVANDVNLVLDANRGDEVYGFNGNRNHRSAPQQGKGFAAGVQIRRVAILACLFLCSSYLGG